MVEELQEKVDKLEKEVKELKEAVRILRQTHSFDMSRAFEAIDDIKYQTI